MTVSAITFPPRFFFLAIFFSAYLIVHSFEKALWPRNSRGGASEGATGHSTNSKINFDHFERIWWSQTALCTSAATTTTSSDIMVYIYVLEALAVLGLISFAIPKIIITIIMQTNFTYATYFIQCAYRRNRRSECSMDKEARRFCSGIGNDVHT